jgi:CHAD domain-containing protein
MTDLPETLADLVGAYLREQCTVIIDSEPKLRAGENVVHVTRVAVRRLRSTIRVFPELFDETKAGALEEELVWWAGLLGAVRDLDILQASLTERIAGLPAELVLGPVESTVQSEIATQRKISMDAVLGAMDSERYRKLMTTLHSWRLDLPFTDAASAPAAEVKRYVKRAEKKVTKRLAAALAARQAAADGQSAEDGDELFHSARKAGKRHRYAVEATVPLWGSKAEKVVAARKDLQDVLGHHQDRIVQAAFLREMGARLGVRSGQNGFTYGILYADVVAAGKTLVDDLKPYV